MFLLFSLQYFAIMLLVTIVELAIAIAALALRPQVDDILLLAWETALNSTNVGVLTFIQTSLNCCGYRSLTDMPAPGCPMTAIEGCYAAMHNVTNSQLLYIGVAALILVFFEVASLIVSCLLHSDPDKDVGHRGILDRE